MDLDDNALYRHPDLEALRDPNEDEPAEKQAREVGLNYVKLDGNIGCMVNGSGLAMGTMDAVKLHGGEPANFLDVSGGANEQQVTAAMRIILSDPKVQAVWINIFGGITRGDVVARGILAGIKAVQTDVPMVIRLVGTNSEEGRQILADAGLVALESMDEAAAKVVAAGPGARGAWAEGGPGVSILVNKDTRLLVQGITGREGAYHTHQMVEYGTKVVAGTTPGKGGSKTEDGVPVFDTVAQAVKETGANVSIIYVPAPFAPDAMYEAADAGLPLIVCITERIPTLEMIKVYEYIKERGLRLIGPNCPGLITPGEAKVGIMPGYIHKPGNVGLVSRSGTLTYEVVNELTQAGLGQSTAIGIGGDPIIGTSFIDALTLFQADPQTEKVVMIGEIGGTDEEAAAAYIRDHMTKPVIGFIAGRTAPPGRRMGHAGAIISGGVGTAEGKMAAMRAAGVQVADAPSQIPALVKNA